MNLLAMRVVPFPYWLLRGGTMLAELPGEAKWNYQLSI
uniref:Uncharacterized protein n=1 Tax=Picea glauca TaxID=3330 RepID=A0A101M070_PICGL|nr:hypothetical protein ABT39_MTgene4433 [Picea glauca]QHR88828.1 hypothetical protein Q903MT_gene2847 [Picea sitchensis]